MPIASAAAINGAPDIGATAAIDGASTIDAMPASPNIDAVAAPADGAPCESFCRGQDQGRD
jgi:hypothetical protein